MRRFVASLLLVQALLASAAMAVTVSPAVTASTAGPVCDVASSSSSLWAGDPMAGAVFLAPPQGCTSICSAAQGKSCSPVGAIRSCFDVNQPDGCEACTCTAAMVWSCDF
jgi:hypothetical protein